MVPRSCFTHSPLLVEPARYFFLTGLFDNIGNAIGSMTDEFMKSPGDRNLHDIDEEFTKDSGWLIRLILQNKQYLLKDFVSEYPQDLNVGYILKTHRWLDRQFINQHEDIWVFNGLLVTTGTVTLYQGKTNEKREFPLDLKLHIEIPGRFYQDTGYFSFLKESISVKDDTLFYIDEFDTIVLKEFEKLSLGELSFEHMEKLGPYNQVGNINQAFFSGYEYFHELQNVYRQIRYSIALAKTYWHYSNRFTEFEFIHKGEKIFKPNVTKYDRRYLDHCSTCAQNIYIFWERIAMLVAQYINPMSTKLVNISFKKLGHEILKKYNDNLDVSDSLKWLQGLLLSHLMLQDLRHPLVHFRVSSDGNKGSKLPEIFLKAVKSSWSENDLIELEIENKKLIERIFAQANLCVDGYNRSVELILDCLKFEEKKSNNSDSS